MNPEGSALTGKSFFTFKLSSKSPKIERALKTPVCENDYAERIAGRPKDQYPACVHEIAQGTGGRVDVSVVLGLTCAFEQSPMTSRGSIRSSRCFA